MSTALWYYWCDIVGLWVEKSCEYVDNWLQGTQPWKTVATATLVTFVSTYVYCSIRQRIREGDEILSKRLKRWLFSNVRKMPIVRRKVEEKVKEARDDINDNLFQLRGDLTYSTHIPFEGLSADTIMDKLHQYSKLDDYDDEKLSGQVYQNNKEITELATRAFNYHSYSNPLHADVFQDIRKIEAETAKFVCNMFKGGPDSQGIVTTGGSESLLLAVLAARNHAYARGIRYPELVMPVTAHAAFDKACFYFRVKAVHVQVDKSFHVNLSKMKRAINRNTCLLVGSFPEFPYGLLDPIEQISALGVEYDIPVHVDACLGGFVVAFMEKCGHKLPKFDFTLPGVMSISCDTHKYGYAPKGTSTLVFRSPEYMQNMYFSQPDWPGGIYATPTTGGSRSGGIIATAWATMLFVGEKGYIEASEKIVRTTQALAHGISEIDGLVLMGDPKVCVVSWTSDMFDIWRQYEMLTKRRWFLGTTQFPGGIHFTVTMKHVEPDWLPSFLNDIKETADICMQSRHEKARGQAAMYGMSQTVPDRSLIQEITYLFWHKYCRTY